MAETFVWRDIEFTAVARPGSSMVNWRVAEQVGFTDDGTIYYARAGATGSDDMAADLANAEIVLEGTIKWDGCSDLSISPGQSLHLCGYRNVQQFQAMLTRLYEMTAWFVDNTDDMPPARYWPTQEFTPSR